MAKEILVVPETHLQEVVDVIRAGLHVIGKNITPEAAEQLKKWCDEEQSYLEDMSKPDR